MACRFRVRASRVGAPMGREPLEQVQAADIEARLLPQGSRRKPTTWSADRDVQFRERSSLTVPASPTARGRRLSSSGSYVERVARPRPCPGSGPVSDGFSRWAAQHVGGAVDCRGPAPRSSRIPGPEPQLGEALLHASEVPGTQLVSRASPTGRERRCDWKRGASALGQAPQPGRTRPAPSPAARWRLQSRPDAERPISPHQPFLRASPAPLIA